MVVGRGLGIISKLGFVSMHLEYLLSIRAAIITTKSIMTNSLRYNVGPPHCQA